MTGGSTAGSQIGGVSKKRSVDRIDNGLCTDLLSSEESTIEALDSVLTTLDFLKFKIHVARSVLVQSNVDDLAVFFATLDTNVFFKLLYPILACFSVGELRLACFKGKRAPSRGETPISRKRVYLLRRIEHVPQ